MTACFGEDKKQIMMRQDVQISFCLPVYNVKEYLDACIRSIYRQNLSGFEIICVDDGSTDGSGEELERIAALHQEIVVLHNGSNRGIGYSRNEAIQKSVGKYLWFVDADDMLAPDTANLYLDVAEKTDADVVLGRCVGFSQSDESLPHDTGTDHYEAVSFSDPDRFYSRSARGYVCFGVWAGIFRRAFLAENGLFFREDIRSLEECTFYAQFGVKAKRVVSVDHFGYYYRHRNDSVSHGEKRLFYVAEAAKTVLGLMEELRLSHPDFDESLRILMTRIERNTEYCLVRIPDAAYVRETLRLLKEKGFYPHGVGSKAYMLRDQNAKLRVLRRALRMEPFFWMIHACYRLRRFLGKRGKSTA